MPHDSAPKFDLWDPWAPKHSRGAGGFWGEGQNSNPFSLAARARNKPFGTAKVRTMVYRAERHGALIPSQSLLVACGPRRCAQAREAEVSRVRLDCAIGVLGRCRCGCATAMPSSPVAQGTHNMPRRICQTVVLTTLNIYRRKPLLSVA